MKIEDFTVPRKAGWCAEGQLDVVTTKATRWLSLASRFIAFIQAFMVSPGSNEMG